MPFRLGRRYADGSRVKLEWSARDESQGAVQVGVLRMDYADQTVALMNEALPALAKLEKIRLLVHTRGTADPLVQKILDVLNGKKVEDEL